MSSDFRYQKHPVGELLDLDEVLRAASVALELSLDDASDVILTAASAMRADASDFDCGIAAGIALARYLDIWNAEKLSPRNCTTDD